MHGLSSKTGTGCDPDNDWHPHFSRNAIEFALRHPYSTLLLAARRRGFEEAQRGLVDRDLRTIERRFGRLAPSHKAFLELSPGEQQLFLRRLGPTNREYVQAGLTQWHSFLYAAVRSLRPRLVVETGVLYGYSASAILQALETNETGTLISVDLPPTEHSVRVSPGQSIQVGLLSRQHSVGSAIPLRLRSRWKLYLGDSLAVLPGILRVPGSISMFVHDSLHTYEHMMAEYYIGYDALERGGLLVSDDVDYNPAWAEFATLHRENHVELKKGIEGNRFGFLVKSQPGAREEDKDAVL